MDPAKAAKMKALMSMADESELPYGQRSDELEETGDEPAPVAAAPTAKANSLGALDRMMTDYDLGPGFDKLPKQGDVSDFEIGPVSEVSRASDWDPKVTGEIGPVAEVSRTTVYPFGDAAGDQEVAEWKKQIPHQVPKSVGSADEMDDDTLALGH